jgi:hypothetical protein
MRANRIDALRNSNGASAAWPFEGLSSFSSGLPTHNPRSLLSDYYPDYDITGYSSLQQHDQDTGQASPWQTSGLQASCSSDTQMELPAFMTNRCNLPQGVSSSPSQSETELFRFSYGSQHSFLCSEDGQLQQSLLQGGNDYGDAFSLLGQAGLLVPSGPGSPQGSHSFDRKMSSAGVLIPPAPATPPQVRTFNRKASFGSSSHTSPRSPSSQAADQRSQTLFGSGPFPRGRGGHRGQVFSGGRGPTSEQGDRGFSRRGGGGGEAVNVLVRKVQAVQAGTSLPQEIFRTIGELSSRDVASLMTDLRKRGARERAREISQWIRGIPQGHAVEHLCDVMTYTAMIAACIEVKACALHTPPIPVLLCTLFTILQVWTQG